MVYDDVCGALCVYDSAVHIYLLHLPILYKYIT